MNSVASFPVQLTRRQVDQAMEQLVDDIQTQWLDEEAAENVAVFLSREFERNLLRHYVLPRVVDCLEMAWLNANAVEWIVKSSVDQFRDEGLVRIHVNDKADRARFKKWRDA